MNENDYKINRQNIKIKNLKNKRLFNAELKY